MNIINKLYTPTLMLLAASTISVPNGDALPHSQTSTQEIQMILGIIFGLIGAIAVLFVAISGLRYILSGGDPQKTAKAKDGIIYSLVGVAVALTAEAIVTFVIGRLG